MRNWIKRLIWPVIIALVAFAFQVVLYLFLGRDPVEIVGDKVKMFYFEPTFLVYAGVFSGVAALLAGLADLKYDWTGQIQRNFNKSIETVKSKVWPRDWDIQDTLEWWYKTTGFKKGDAETIDFFDILSQLAQDDLEDGGITFWGRPDALHHSWEKIDKDHWKNNRIETLGYIYAADKDAVRNIPTYPKIGHENTGTKYYDLRLTSAEVKKKWPKESKRNYLSDEDTELGTAIHYMAMFSAWAKWFAAQHLALNEHKPISESSMMSTASFLVLDAAMNGKLSMRGRPAGSIQYEAISRETWRLIAIKMEPHPATLWKAVVIPRSDVDQERVQEILEYDSIILSSREFEQLWPRDDRGHDRARMKELKKAKRLGADAQAVEKLAKGNMAI